MAEKRNGEHIEASKINEQKSGRVPGEKHKHRKESDSLAYNPVSPPKTSRKDGSNKAFEETLKIIEAFLSSGEDGKNILSELDESEGEERLLSSGGQKKVLTEGSDNHPPPVYRSLGRPMSLDFSLDDDIASDGLNSPGQSQEGPLQSNEVASLLKEPWIQEIGSKIKKMADVENERQKKQNGEFSGKFTEVAVKLAKDAAYASISTSLNSFLGVLPNDKETQIALVLQVAKQAYEASSGSPDRAFAENLTQYIVDTYGSLTDYFKASDEKK